MRRPGLIVFSLLALLAAGCAGDFYAPVSERSPGQREEADNGEYRVVRGDTLFQIAFRHDLDHQALARWNDIDEPYTIYPGQTLRLTPPSHAAGSGTTGSGGQRQAGGPSPAATTPPAERSQAPRNTTPPPRDSDDWVWPASGELVKAFSADADGKQGINIAGEEGDEVRAAAAGRVVYSGSGLVGYGNLIILKHEGDFLTAYGYNQELLVEEGDAVRQGETIARMGLRGGRPLLHFELRESGRPVDPARHLPASR